MDVANDIAKIFGLPTTKITHVRDRAFNDRRYYICDDKLSRLGAHPSSAVSAADSTMQTDESAQFGKHAGCPFGGLR